MIGTSNKNKGFRRLVSFKPEGFHTPVPATIEHECVFGNPEGLTQ